MTIPEINSTIAALHMIKATVEWDYPLDYQADIDKAIAGLEELKAIKEKPQKGKCEWSFDFGAKKLGSVMSGCGHKDEFRYLENCPYCGKKILWKGCERK